MFRKSLKYLNVGIFRGQHTMSLRNRPKFSYSRLLQVSSQFKKLCIQPVAFVTTAAYAFWSLNEVEREDTELEKTLKMGIILANKGEINKAEKMFHLALKIAQDTHHIQGITYAYDMLANLAFDSGNWGKAEKLFRDIIKRLIAEGVDQVDNKIMSISMKLAKIYWATDRKGEAEMGYQFCIENLEQKVSKTGDRSEDTLLLLSRSLDDYGHFLFENNRFTDSFNAFKKSYDTFVEAKGKLFDQAVIILGDMGTVCMLTGQLDKALDFYKEAVATASSLDEEFDSLSTIYTNIGQIYLLKNMLVEAEKACVIGRSLADKHNNREAADDAEQLLKDIRKLTRQR